MDVMRAGTVAILMLGLAGSASAQQRPGTAEPEPIRIDVSLLPLNLQRIQRQLQQSASKEERDGMNLRYQIEVYGRAPDIKLFTPEDNLGTGPVPYGAPTHREMIEQITPQEFRSPVMDFTSLFKWLAEKAKK